MLPGKMSQHQHTHVNLLHVHVLEFYGAKNAAHITVFQKPTHHYHKHVHVEKIMAVLTWISASESLLLRFLLGWPAGLLSTDLALKEVCGCPCRMCILPFCTEKRLLGSELGVSDRPHSKLAPFMLLTFRARGKVPCFSVVATDSLARKGGWSWGGKPLVL